MLVFSGLQKPPFKMESSGEVSKPMTPSTGSINKQSVRLFKYLKHAFIVISWEVSKVFDKHSNSVLILLKLHSIHPKQKK